MLPQPGHVVELTLAASPQFTRPYAFRVIRTQQWTTYDGWAWLHGYELDARGDAVGEKPRDVFVQVAGLRRVEAPQPKPRTQRPAPRQRTQLTWHLAKEAPHG